MGNTGDESSFKEQSSNSIRNIFLALSTSVRLILCVRFVSFQYE